MDERGTWRDRLLAGAFAGAVATVAYRGIQAATLKRALLREECWSWTWLPFDTRWLGWYLSMFVLVGLPWFILPTWSQVLRFGQCLLGMAAIGWVTFLLYPTACVRPGAQGCVHGFLLSLDGANNCLPCLHSAMSVLAAGVIWTREDRRPGRFVQATLVLWVVLICISIVALRQHTDGDMLIGVLLGLVATFVYRRTLAGPAKG